MRVDCDRPRDESGLKNVECRTARVVHRRVDVNTLYGDGRTTKLASSSASQVMVVAVELGGQWRFQLRPEVGVDLVLVAQLSGEDHSVFARRLLKKVVGLVEKGAEVVSAALVVSAAFDICRLEARCMIARAVLRAFRVDAKRELHLVEPIDSTTDCHSHLSRPWPKACSREQGRIVESAWAPEFMVSRSCLA